MRRGLLCLPMLMVVSVVIAQDQLPQYAQTTSKVATAIYEGENLDNVDELFELTLFERSELARLSGCDGEIQPGGRETEVRIFWRCASTSQRPDLLRSTSFLFDDQGELIALAINSIDSNESGSSARSHDIDLRSRGIIASDFASAVLAGEDASLGGVIPLDDFEIGRLSELRADSFRVLKRSDPSLRIIRFYSEDGYVPSVWLRFDETGYPKGVDFAPRYDPNRSGRSIRADRARRARENSQEITARNRNSQRQHTHRDISQRTRKLCPSC